MVIVSVGDSLLFIERKPLLTLKLAGGRQGPPAVVAARLDRRALSSLVQFARPLVYPSLHSIRPLYLKETSPMTIWANLHAGMSSGRAWLPAGRVRPTTTRTRPVDLGLPGLASPVCWLSDASLAVWLLSCICMWWVASWLAACEYVSGLVYLSFLS